jgi:hypothetical protein
MIKTPIQPSIRLIFWLVCRHAPPAVTQDNHANALAAFIRTMYVSTLMLVLGVRHVMAL